MKKQNLLASEAFPGLLLCLASLAALGLENSSFAYFYDLFKNVPVLFQAGSFIIDKPLLLWINDGLMAVFFLLIGLEIKREIVQGHLAVLSQALLPIAAALGGVLIPALIYSYINKGDPAALRGWAIPAATDIAFALSALAALGSRIPASLKVCLAAIAIIDDLIAVIIIALFYTAEISLFSLGLAFAGLALAAYMNWKKVTNLGPYIVVGLFIWACVLKSGVHATLAGVALGLLIPLKDKNERGEKPLEVMEHALRPWAMFAIVPLFAFVNAGVSFAGLGTDLFLNPITLGVCLGLFLGKPAGIMAFSYLLVVLRISRLPDGVSWRHYAGMALFTGIGFTMSLFIGTLAFPSIENLAAVRIGVITGSVLSVVAGLLVLGSQRKELGLIGRAYRIIKD